MKRLIIGLALVALVLVPAACDDNSADVFFDDSTGIYFPVQKSGDLAQMTALMEGRLVLDDVYLRVVDSHSSYLAIWPHGFSLRTEGDEIQVLDADGQVVGIVGDRMKVGGGEGANVEIVENYIGRSLPEGCTGPFWIVSEVVID